LVKDRYFYPWLIVVGRNGPFRGKPWKGMVKDYLKS
jgi:hypothetical protein